MSLKIKMCREVQRYTVWAYDDRFAIMTKPFNARRTYLYTITDLQLKVRGPCNLIFGLPCDVNCQSGAAYALQMLQNGVMEISYRRCIDLTAEEISQIISLPAPAPIPEGVE